MNKRLNILAVFALVIGLGLASHAHAQLVCTPDPKEPGATMEPCTCVAPRPAPASCADVQPGKYQSGCDWGADETTHNGHASCYTYPAGHTQADYEAAQKATRDAEIQEAIKASQPVFTAPDTSGLTSALTNLSTPTLSVDTPVDASTSDPRVIALMQQIISILLELISKLQAR